jgi:[protein-PII] uridylyltransferase
MGQTGRQEIIKRLRDRIEKGHEEIFALHRSGSAGLEVVRRNSDIMDRVIRDIYGFCCEEAGRGGKGETDGMALVALGGYGRGELNPYSDIDLLFLYHRKLDEFSDFVVKEVLYILWDLGLHVGHSCRSITDCIKIARDDTTVRTSMLESRHICGDELITSQLMQTLYKDFLSRGARVFLKTKAGERDHRHAQYGHAATYMEPHVKEGKGGLRDCHLALWCGMVKYGVRELSGLEKVGILTPQEFQEFSAAYSFLHQVRNELHFIAKQRSDVLSLEVQKEVAENLGYESDGVFPAVELFMKDYFLRAKEVDRYSRSVLEVCLSGRTHFSRLRRFLGRRKVGKGLYSVNGDIVVHGNPFKGNPILMFELFRFCQVRGVTPSQSTLRVIRHNLHLAGEDFVQSKEVIDILKDILSRDGAAETVRSMHEAGLLGKCITEYEGLTCLAQHDLYHSYTVDEHMLRALKHLEDLKRTREPELKELSSIYNRVRQPWLLKLAVLLHDVGKIRGRGHVKAGVAIISEISRRWGLEGPDAEKLIFLVENHLTMSHLAQRRDIKDEKTVAGFARMVENEEHLSLLYLLTYADTRSVGPQVWTVWKGALLWELYHETHNYFVRGVEPESRWEDEQVKIKNRVAAALEKDVSMEEVDDFFHTMPYRYLREVPPHKLARHLELARGLEAKTISLHQSHDSVRGYTELVVCSREKPGLFSRITGTLSAMNINIISAQIYTGTDGMVLDILQVNGLDGKPVTDDESWEKVNRYLTGILEGELTVEQLLAERKRPIQSRKTEYMEVSPKVTLDNSSSDTHTIVEVVAQDRLGLLYTIANTLFTEGANIYLAKISTEVHRAINAFYVTDFRGRKIEDQKDLRRLEKKLLDALSAVD